MKTMIISVLIAITFIMNNASGNESKMEIQNKNYYAENVHMYICIEALKLLKDRISQTDLSQIENRIGTMSDIGTRPWQVGKITTGAYREDIEDVVFDIRGPFGLEASCSHFWEADDRTNGDHSLTHLPVIGSYPNAYTKMTKLVNGQWFRWSNGYQERTYINYNASDGKVYKYSYHTRGFINFYKTKIIFLHSKVNSLGQEEFIDREIQLTDEVFHRIVWEVVGRMAHLIADMTVPAHTHSDVHIRPLDGGDCYHNYIDDGGYTFYNWQTAKSEGGYINPYETGNDPIRYLTYTANQLADHYPSGPECLEIPQQHTGDHSLPGGSNPVINQYYQLLGSPPQNIINTYQEGQHCFNFAIRSTAGLFYWLAVETGMITPDPGALPVIHSFTKNLSDNTIFRGETLRLTCNASGSNLNYNWFYKICNVNNWCTLPVNGLSFNQNNNVFSASNYNFNNRWTCSFFDSLCNANVHVNNVYSENPLQVIIGVTVSNQFAQVTKYYDENQIQHITPYNGIRPPDPPVSGCPFLFSYGTESLIIENNILHCSTFPGNENKDIIDKIVISKKLILDTTNNLFSFAVCESANDNNFFNSISLIEVDHHKDYSILVTENLDLALMKNSDVESPDHAEKNGTDVTDVLRFDADFENEVKGMEKDIINLEFKQDKFSGAKQKFTDELLKAKYKLDVINEIKDSIALILDPSEPDHSKILTQKRPAGYISITDTSGIKVTDDIDFTRRVERSMITIPILSGGDLSRAGMVFKSSFDLSYCAAARIFYGGFTENKLELVEAENSLSGDIFKKLLRDDKDYAEMDSSSFITLKFKYTDRVIPKDWVRDYVMIINGRTVVPENSQNKISSEHHHYSSDNNLMREKHELYQNYPNPFNPATEIKYFLPEDQYTKITVYDQLGKEVGLLVNERQNAGIHSVKFNAENLPSGIYYYKIISGEFTMIRKMIVLK